MKCLWRDTMHCQEWGSIKSLKKQSEISQSKKIIVKHVNMLYHIQYSITEHRKAISASRKRCSKENVQRMNPIIFHTVKNWVNSLNIPTIPKYVGKVFVIFVKQKKIFP